MNECMSVPEELRVEGEGLEAKAVWKQKREPRFLDGVHQELSRGWDDEATTADTASMDQDHGVRRFFRRCSRTVELFIVL